jgi:hypothetical protein
MARHQVLVVVSDRLRLLADVVADALARDPDVGCVEVAHSEERARELVSAGGITIAVVDEEFLRAWPLARLFEAEAHMSVVVLRESARMATNTELSPIELLATTTELWPRSGAPDVVSPDRLRAALRATTAWDDRFSAPADRGGCA